MKETVCRYWFLNLAFEKVMEETLDLFFSKPGGMARPTLKMKNQKKCQCFIRGKQDDLNLSC